MTNFSIIIPVYNEEKYLENQVSKLIGAIEQSSNRASNYEVILVENGSNDKTCGIAHTLAKKYKQIKVFCLPFPSYGLAFKEGIKKAKYEYIFQFDLDFWDIHFLKKSLKKLETHDFIIGSKNLCRSNDQRSYLRKLVSKLTERLIQLRFDTILTDTHGLKAFKKNLVMNLLDEIKCPNHFFDSELLIRLEKSGSSFRELPVNLKELRKSRFPFLIRSREALQELFILLTLNLKPKVVYQPYAFRLQKAVVNYLMSLFM